MPPHVMNWFDYTVLAAVLYVAYRLYMLPTYIGKRRGVDRLDTLRMFNMWAGWFPIGYACCLAYSVGGPTTAQVQAQYAYQRKIHRLVDNADTLFDEAVQRREPSIPRTQQAEPLAVDETLGDKTMAEKFIYDGKEEALQFGTETWQDGRGSYEVRFPDGSFVHMVNYLWRIGRHPAMQAA